MLPLEDFRTVINEHQPFGPLRAEDLWDAGAAAAQELFDTENYLHLLDLEAQPAIIIGRKGSGKTAFLRSQTKNSPQLRIEVKTSQAFARVRQVLKHWDTLDAEHFLSHSRGLWRSALWHTVFAALVRTAPASNERTLLENYLEGLTASKKPKEMTAFDRFCQEILSRTHTNDLTLVYDIESLKCHGIALEQAREAAARLLPQLDGAILLLDSMEDLEKVTTNINPDAMQGLLSLIGERGQPHAYQTRLALPAELIYPVAEMSANPLKDLSRSMHLHWSAAELTAIAAHRFAIYAALFQKDALNALGFKFLDLDDEHEVARLFTSVFPDHVMNKFGKPEGPLPYLLRHTQLLPRHFLFLLNHVWVAHASSRAASLTISPETMRTAVEGIERSLALEICSAFKPRHPTATPLCEALIPQMNLTMSWGEFHRQFNRFGRKASQGLDADEARGMLAEIGCIGRLTRITPRYIEAEFEYTMPRRLAFSDSDTICLHPLFAGGFGCREANGGFDNNTKPIYPFGWDSAGPDHRQH